MKRPTKLDNLLDVGQQLSNVAYNLAQRGSTERERELFSGLAKTWDEARRALARELPGETRPLPFKSRTDAMNAVKFACDQAAAGIDALSKRLRTTAPHRRSQLATIRRGLNQLVRERYRKGRT